MSLRWILAAALVTAASMALQAAPPACGPDATAALTAAETDVARGEVSAAAEGLRARYDAAATCPDIAVATWSLRGWLAARAAAERGGTAESLAPVTQALDVLTTLGPPVSPAAYATAVLHAAAAAAQDERDEMSVWMDHARDLARRLGTEAAPRWPLPPDEAEAELWHAVDDFELADAAFRRALAVRDSAAAWRGLARARDRRGDRRGACEAYRHVIDRATLPAGPTLLTEARAYLLLCGP